MTSMPLSPVFMGLDNKKDQFMNKVEEELIEANLEGKSNKKLVDLMLTLADNSYTEGSQAMFWYIEKLSMGKESKDE